MCDNIFQGGGGGLFKESEMYLKKTQNNNKVYDMITKPSYTLLPVQ